MFDFGVADPEQFMDKRHLAVVRDLHILEPFVLWQATRAGDHRSIRGLRAGFQKSARVADPADWRAWLAGMIVRRVTASSLPCLPPAAEPAVVARSLLGVQGHRAPCAAPRSRRVAQS